MTVEAMRRLLTELNVADTTEILIWDEHECLPREVVGAHRWKIGGETVVLVDLR